jgi:hypothetical protein
LIAFAVDTNQLTGSVPDLTGLPGLRYFMVGANHLTGVLPAASSGLVAGGSTLCPNDFPESSYVGASAWDAATGHRALVCPMRHNCFWRWI